MRTASFRIQSEIRVNVKVQDSPIVLSACLQTDLGQLGFCAWKIDLALFDVRQMCCSHVGISLLSALLNDARFVYSNRSSILKSKVDF